MTSKCHNSRAVATYPIRLVYCINAEMAVGSSYLFTEHVTVLIYNARRSSVTSSHRYFGSVQLSYKLPDSWFPSRNVSFSSGLICPSYIWMLIDLIDAFDVHSLPRI